MYWHFICGNCSIDGNCPAQSAHEVEICDVVNDCIERENMTHDEVLLEKVTNAEDD